jgi:hypothetical protein
VHELLADLRYGARMLRKAPVTSLVAVVSLGFAIATNTTAFSVASGFLLSSFRWQSPRELVVLEANNRNDTEGGEAAPGDYLDWKRRART